MRLTGADKRQNSIKLIAIRLSIASLALLLVISVLAPKHVAAGIERLEFAGKYEGDRIFRDTRLGEGGSVSGDLALVGKSAVMEGTVGGDLLVIAADLEVSGLVEGDLRSVSGTLDIAGTVGKNVTSAAGRVTLTEEGIVEGNLYLIAETAELAGNVKGNTNVIAGRIVLSGTFYGDVSLTHTQGGKNASMPVILPGTVIAGTLEYRAENEIELPAGVSIGELAFIRTSPTPHGMRRADLTGIVVMRQILSMLLLYLFSLILIRVFPRYFKQSELALKENLPAVTGMGAAFFGLTLLYAILLIPLGIAAALLFQPVVMISALLFLISVIIFSSILALIPVSLMLGNLIIKDRWGAPASLAIGLGILTTLRILSLLFAVILRTGPPLIVFESIVWFAIGLAGTGSLLWSLKETRRANKATVGLLSDVEISNDKLF